MTYRTDVARGRDVVARWCTLAEQRLEYLTELFETGRWRRYHTELAFLENIQEAKIAVEIWRDLSTCEASRDNFAVDVSWLGRPRTALPRDIWPSHGHRFTPQPAQNHAQPLLRDVSMSAETGQVCSDEAPSAPGSNEPVIDSAPESVLQPVIDRTPDPVVDRLTRDIAAIAERYPLLRNVM